MNKLIKYYISITEKTVLFDNSDKSSKHTIQLAIEPAIGSIVGRVVVSGWIFHSQQISVHGNFVSQQKKYSITKFCISEIIF